MVTTRRPRSVEKNNQEEVEYMSNNIWIDTKLSQEEMNFLRDACSSDDSRKDWKGELAGNIYKSELIEDNRIDWFYETVLKKYTERMFYRDWDTYYKYCIEKEEPPPKFKLRSLWVNYQKQYEFNPLHGHTCLYTFVVFMKIPTHWKEQHALPISANSNAPIASDFSFVWSEKDGEVVLPTNFSLSPEDEGRMLFFPGFLKHQVYPFYGTEEERITISGNIIFADQMNPKKQELSIDQYEEKKKIIKFMEISIESFKKELEQMKKMEKNGGLN